MLCRSAAYAVLRCLSGWVSVLRSCMYYIETTKDTAIVAMEGKQETTPIRIVSCPMILSDPETRIQGCATIQR